MSYSVKLRTKNHSADDLRDAIRAIKTKTPVVVRLGSRTPISQIFPRSHNVAVEINPISGIENSRDKLIMKRCFDRDGVRTAEWAEMAPVMTWNTFPAIIKHKGSHGGGGIFLVNNLEELNAWKTSYPGLHQYLIEKYYKYTKEYRLHVDADGCFYTCRKMLKADAEDRWHRHDSNCVWFVEENEKFDKPSNWDTIVAESVKSLNAVGLTIGAVDIKVQSEKERKRESPEFIILEINSAPSMGEGTTIKYVEEIKKLTKDL